MGRERGKKKKMGREREKGEKKREKRRGRRKVGSNFHYALVGCPTILL